MSAHPLTTKQKMNAFLLRPLVMSLSAFVLIYFLESGSPNWNSLIGIALGFFIGSIAVGLLFPQWIQKMDNNNSTKKQKRIGVIVFAGSIAVILLLFFLDT
ncbi:hypothetical protein EEX84_11475 [Planococcus salinus]|uniref:Uncharacterized protein n=2 Tax=Planococcus salinus TaxID=1848460 RepID=A0A3M8P734_9BACL|nr:hypothetical protein EEX84_11475 [Planococcus salinus]